MEFADIFSSFLQGFQITEANVKQDEVVISAKMIPHAVPCPDCHCLSNRIHSCYTRIPHDLACCFTERDCT